MRIPNEPGDGPTSSLGELLRLQSQFAARLADETIGYMRRLQGVAAPNSPGTVVMPDPDLLLAASGVPGGVVQLSLEMENRQRVHCMVTPQLAPLVDAGGVTWSPAAEATPPSQLVAPGDVGRLALAVAVPTDLPAGTYRGVLSLQGFREGAIPVAITVSAADAGAKP